MNKQQQELYEKLLKKVNEHCLGYAAEDVIAAIDDLLDTYETALKRLETVDRVGEMFCINVDKKLKALEIINNRQVDVYALKEAEKIEDYNNFILGLHSFDRQEAESEMLTQEEFELLKEILK